MGFAYIALAYGNVLCRIGKTIFRLAVKQISEADKKCERQTKKWHCQPAILRLIAAKFSIGMRFKSDIVT
jgi:hypothetical protein